MLDLLKHAALVIGMLDLLHLDHLGLFEHLDGIEALVVLGLNQVDSAKATSTEGALDGKVGQRVLALCRARLVERLRLKSGDSAILGGLIVGVDEVLYARRVGGLGGRRLLLLLRLLRRRGLVIDGVHRVGGLGRLLRRIDGRLAGLAPVQVEGA